MHVIGIRPYGYIALHLTVFYTIYAQPLIITYKYSFFRSEIKMPLRELRRSIYYQYIIIYMYADDR